MFSSSYFQPEEFIKEKFFQLPENILKASICGSPYTNSFYNSGYIKGQIPKIYRLSYAKWIKKLENKKNWNFYEHYLKGSTFHAKGFWY